jgi:protein MpaA
VGNAGDSRPARRTRALVAVLATATIVGCGGSGAPGPRPAEPAARPPAAIVPATHAGRTAPLRVVLGHSEGGRPITMVHAGDGRGARVLVVGAIHGDELAGAAVARALQRIRAGADLWIVPDLNPDGAASGTRQNGRGVDLNRNWSSQWQGGGKPWDVYYAGPHAFSERETRIARRLILRVRPQITIWFHQHMNLVWAWGDSTATGRRYARAAGMRLYHHHWLRGTASNWQNHRFAGTAALTVELPAGRLTPRQVRRHVRAILTLGPGGA